jgi:hypothetical protein
MAEFVAYVFGSLTRSGRQDRATAYVQGADAGRAADVDPADRHRLALVNGRQILELNCPNTARERS